MVPRPADVSLPFLAVTAAASLVCAWALTAVVLRYAVRRELLDHPNHRSSHTLPTPRGGGLAIVATVLAGVPLLALVGVIDGPTALALVGAGGIVAVAGWLDDLRGVPPAWRALAHLAAAAWALMWMGGMPAVRIAGEPFPLGMAGVGLAAVGIVWATNLYNFMDGIDGIAGVETVSVAGGGAILLSLAGEPGLAAAATVLAAAAAGFLAWNWQPARIFMGDVGSGTLGCMLAVLAIASENRASVPLSAWLLLGGVFVADATLTLLRRMLRGESWMQPHRQHAYQRLVRSGWSHARVSGGVMGVNLVLIVLAAWVVMAPRHQTLALAVGAVLLLGIYGWIEARHPMEDGKPTDV